MKSAMILYFVSGVMGFFILSMMAVGLDFGCEVSYPVPANNASGLMLAYSQLLSTAQIVAASFILTSSGDTSVSKYWKKLRSIITVTIFTASIATGMLCSTFVKQDLRKARIDAKKSIVSKLDVDAT